MAFDLPRVTRSLSRRRRPITFRAVEDSKSSVTSLFAIYMQVVRLWHESARTRILPVYVASLEQRKRADLTLDDISDLGAELEFADSSAYRLILRLTPDIRSWVVRLEELQRGKFIASAKTAAGIDLSTILTQSGVQTTVDSVFTANLSLIRNLSDDMRSRIGNVVFQGFQQRTPRNELAGLINDATGIGRNRALLIASDQSTKMSAALDQERQQEIGITEFKWRHSGKVHFRPHHKARDGKIYSWQNNDLGGDLPGVAINCGCKAQAHIDLGE